MPQKMKKTFKIINRMKKSRLLPFLFLGFALWTCNLMEGKPDEEKPLPRKMEYSYACVDSTVSESELNKTIRKTTDVITNLAVRQSKITDELQNEYGDAFHQDAVETGTFKLDNDPQINARLQKVMDELLPMRENPTQIKYSIYLLADDEITAFTFGGHIYVTKAMYEKCKNDESLLYAIIGHEIGHSEKGHIKKTIQQMMLSEELFGSENGMTVFQLQKLITASFNQHNELEADYYGTDLTYKLNKDVCSAVSFWKEMAKSENAYNKVEDFFRTHPFSALRAQCLKDHIWTNFRQNCTVQ